MHSAFHRDPERYTKVSVANRHLVITTIKGKILVIHDYKTLLDSMNPRVLRPSQMEAILRRNSMVISTDSNVLDLSTYGNKIGMRLSHGCRSRRDDFLLFLDAECLPDLRDRRREVRLRSWVVIAPIDHTVLGCGRDAGGMAIDNYGVCLPGARKCELPLSSA